MTKVALSLIALFLTLPLRAGAQTMGGTLAPPAVHPSLPWTRPAHPGAVEVSGADETYLPSTFVSFDRAVAAGKADLKEQSKSIAEVAAESRKTVRAAAKLRVAQDSSGKLVVARK